MEVTGAPRPMQFDAAGRLPCSPSLLILADDFTGACDAAAAFGAQRRTHVVTRVPDGVAGWTRTSWPWTSTCASARTTDASSRACAAPCTSWARQTAGVRENRFDAARPDRRRSSRERSTASGSPRAIVAPAFPEQGRHILQDAGRGRSMAPGRTWRLRDTRRRGRGRDRRVHAQRGSRARRGVTGVAAGRLGRPGAPAGAAARASTTADSRGRGPIADRGGKSDARSRGSRSNACRARLDVVSPRHADRRHARSGPSRRRAGRTRGRLGPPADAARGDPDRRRHRARGQPPPRGDQRCGCAASSNPASRSARSKTASWHGDHGRHQGRRLRRARDAPRRGARAGCFITRTRCMSSDEQAGPGDHHGRSGRHRARDHRQGADPRRRVRPRRGRW